MPLKGLYLLLICFDYDCLTFLLSTIPGPGIEEHTKAVQNLSTQSDACVKRLEKLENMAPCAQDDDDDEAASTKTFETSNSMRTTRNSIFGLYAHTPYVKKLWSTSNSSFITACEEQNSHSKVLEMVEDHLNQLRSPPDPIDAELDTVDGDHGLVDTG